MMRVHDADSELEWLKASPGFDPVCGIDMPGWSASTWLLHSIYLDGSAPSDITHDDAHKLSILLGLQEPEVVGDVNLDDMSSVVGATLGYADWERDPTWPRLLWREAGAMAHGQEWPPCWRWFPETSLPADYVGPSEGSLDRDELAALIEILGRSSASGDASECFVFMASLPAGADFDNVHLWTGPLRDVPTLLGEHGGPYGFTPTNMWAADRSWFVFTDYDLWGTKVSGSDALIAALNADERLEAVEWDWPSGRRRAPLAGEFSVGTTVSERRMQASPSSVWRVLTDPDLLQRVDPRFPLVSVDGPPATVGSRHSIKMFGVVLERTILALEPEKSITMGHRSAAGRNLGTQRGHLRNDDGQTVLRWVVTQRPGPKAGRIASAVICRLALPRWLKRVEREARRLPQ